ncbi:39S ribosomal protein L9, mitochondrial-like [Paramacrobiotus metropolitanus]|uniref:39S ribosomal protein L9, mitochondrial-like n=1 Tax=Paramacrobiotus metropolitanus TaxID=2943436 RepID=UPI002445A378|nr:39S ribosomal protein L9, mitochondrial-like [Paramacrobiotus metropolitanus]
MLNDTVCNVFLNLHTPWTLEKWHIRAALRQNGIWVPDEAIELPSQEITGPHRDQHGKYFSIFLTINKKERACVLCRIVLFCRDPSEILPELDLTAEKPLNPEPLFPGAVVPENTRSGVRWDRSLLSDEPPPSNFTYVPLPVDITRVVRE